MTSSNGQSFTLYNPGNTSLDMSKYQLEYFNSYDLTKATSSKLISLVGILPAHSYYLVNDDSLLLCYQETVDSVSLGLSSTAGMVEVLSLSQSSPGAVVAPTLLDYVSWSKTAVAGAQTLPSDVSASLRRLPLDSQNNPTVSAPGVGSWQAVKPDNANACKLVTVATSSTTSIPALTGLSQLLPSAEPPATIIATTLPDDQPASSSSLPAADVGLMAPEITELLPNPEGTGNDATDEFVELYNPNGSTFDLSGFGLQAGTTVLHKYIFPAGVSLPAQSFVAFYATDTDLSLSNSGGEVKLLDPSGTSISSSQPYDTASDGQSWALAKGSWYWTTTITPNAANVINQPATKKTASKATTSKSKTNSSSAVKGASTKKSAGQTSKSTASLASSDAPNTPIHAWTLALIAGLALLYGAYEYRTDLGNYLHKLRRHRKAGRADRP